MQFEKLEIHTVFLRFSNFYLCQNLSPSTFADFFIGSFGGTLCGCAGSFTPASQVSNYVMLVIHHLCPLVKYEFAQDTDKLSSRPP
jgi:hypothetical protein